ncbi:MAG TPA: dienelactone hydrolase family protein [Trebonia sp.]|jgi:carboxymethylenebutenolidase|nr:dienelactone hydrolase family protein [Trebonia sp.]
MPDAGFRPTGASGFAPGALGEDPAVSREPVRARVTETYLPNGTPVLLAEPLDGEARLNLVLSASLRGFTGMYTELCLRLAQRHRWRIAAPEQFPGLQHLDEKARTEQVARFADEAKLDELEAAADLLGPGPVALAGFCLGGMYALKASGRPRFSALVAFYGMIRLPEHWRAPGQAEPLDCLARPERVLAIAGEHDPLIASSDIADLRGAGVRTLTFPGAGHAFAHDPSLPSYRAADASAAWQAAAAHLASAHQAATVPQLKKEGS